MLASVMLSLSLLTTPAIPPPAAALPLEGKVVVVDPGHQLGNGRHPQEINRLVDAGGFKKPCNTTGTATNAGYPEATFTFGVATRLKRRLEALGAKVVMTRYRNSYDLWGPCIDYRGRLGNASADLKVSIHGDGSLGGGHGFHVIVADRHRHASTPYALATRKALQRAGFDRSTYIGGGTALSFRSDIGTLNLSRMPAVMVELGNMRHSGDARVMSSAKGQARYARALARGALRFLR